MDANRAWRGACPSSPLSSSDDSSPDSRDGSPNYSRPVSSRASRSYDTLNGSPGQQPSPPTGWYSKPGVRSPRLSASEIRTRGTDGETAPVAHWAFASAAVKATGPTRGKSPFWVTSADNVHGQEQPTNHEQIRLATAGAGEAQQVERDQGSVTTEDNYLTDSSTHAGGSTNSWWLVPVMVFGACAGLVLLAVAAVGTTYTYRSVIARIAAAEKAANQHIADLGNRTVLLTEDDGVPEYSEDRDDVADDGANGPRPRIWCFLRRLSPLPSKASTDGRRSTTARSTAAPRGLCSALVYQGVRVVWRDAEASIDVVQPSNEDDLRRLAARRDVDPLLEVYVHVASDQQLVPGSATKVISATGARSPTSPSTTSQAGSTPPQSTATTKEALRSLLRSSQSTTEVFAMRTARWLVVHHLDGLVVELGSAVSGVATELITRLAEMCQRQLGRMGKSFTLVLPESTTLFAQYDLNALLTTSTS